MRVRWLLVFACAAACATDAEPELVTDDLEVPDEDGKADVSNEVRVRVGDTTLWVDRWLERKGDAFVLNGRTSRNITRGNAFVFDDVFGAFEQRSLRTYRVSWQTSELRGVVDGVNLFTSLGFVHSANRPDNLTARVIVRPRLGAIHGSGSLSLTAELTPVIVAGRTLYRIQGRSTKPIANLVASTGTVRLLDPKRFELDLDFDQLVAASVPSAFVSVTAALPGSSTTIRGHLGLAVKRVGLTTGDVEQVFPSPTCTAERLGCLDALPDDALDLASCGPALEVRTCAGQIGVFVDAPAVNAALATADTKLAGAFSIDAPALVGSDRAATLATAVRARIAAGLEAERGLWLLSMVSRTAILGARVDGAIDAAYARPLGLVGGPHAAMPGSLAVTRQVVADALLVFLGQQDYANSEFGRSYDELTKMFRAQHVASLRAFRETVVPENFSSIPGTDVFVDQWIGTYTEVRVERASGTVSSILVEID